MQRNPLWSKESPEEYWEQKYGCYFGGGGGSNRGGETTSITRIDPTFEPYFRRAAGRAEEAAEQVPTTPFPGPFLAEASPLRTQGVQSLTGAAGQIGPGVEETLAGLLPMLTGTARGDYLNQSPALINAIEASTAPVFDQFTEEILPAIRTSATAQDAFNNSRRNVAEGIAAGKAAESANRIAAQLALPFFQQERGLQFDVLDQLGLLPQAAGGPAGMLGIAGAQEEAIAQRPIDEAIAQFTEQQQAPFRAVNPLMGVLSGIPVGQQTSAETQQERLETQGSEIAGSVIGTIGMIAALAALSHSMFKEIEGDAENYLDKLNKMPVKVWRYKGRDELHVSPMAEEFHKVFKLGNEWSIHISDVLGILMMALRELTQRVEALEA